MKRAYGHLKTTARFLPLFLLTFVLASCSNVYRLTIEIQEPAPITLPLNVASVAIVNNTVLQPDSIGLERTWNDKDFTGFYPNLDSASSISAQALSEVISEANFFNKIILYKERIRNDQEWLSRKPLSPEFRSKLYDSIHVDAIISVDQLLFNTIEKVKNTSKVTTSLVTDVFADTRIDGKLTCSIYLKTREKPLTTFTVIDSSFFKSSFSVDSVKTIIFKNLPLMLILEVAESLGEKTGDHFIPYWKKADRFIFTDVDSRMKEATSYFKNKKWQDAENSWNGIYETEKNSLKKARLAVNIAVAKEMQDKLKEAVSWAENANALYLTTNTKQNTEEIQLIKTYQGELQKRLINNHLLDIQWGVTEE